MAKKKDPCTGATSEPNYVTPIHDRSLEKFSSDPQMDPGPWASYTLGYEPQVLPVWLHLQEPRFYHLGLQTPLPGYRTDKSIPSSICALRCAIDVLCEYIDPRVVKRVDTILDRLQTHNGDLTKSIVQNTYEASIDELFEIGEKLSNSMSILAQKSIPEDGRLGLWHKLGWELGRWWCQNYFNDGDEVVHPFRPVILAIDRLPSDEKTSHEMLGKLSRLLETDGQDETQLLSDVVGIVASEASPTKRINSLSAYSHIRALHEQIECSLLMRQRPLSRGGGIPRWHKEKGQLLLDGEVIRDVRVRQKSHVVRILDEFQRLGWPRKIVDPLLLEERTRFDANNANTVPEAKKARFKDIIRRTKKEALASVNVGLDRIVFRGTGLEGEISWHVDPSKTSDGQQS